MQHAACHAAPCDGEAEIGRGLLTAACSRAVGRHELLPEVPKLRRVHHHELDLPTGRRGDDAVTTRCRAPSSAQCHTQTSLRCMVADCMLFATRRAVCWVPRGMSRRMSWQCRDNHKAAAGRAVDEQARQHAMVTAPLICPVAAAPGRCRIQGQNVRLGAMERAACNV